MILKLTKTKFKIISHHRYNKDIWFIKWRQMFQILTCGCRFLTMCHQHHYPLSRPKVEMCTGSDGSPSHWSSLGGKKMLVEPQSIQAQMRCMSPCMSQPLSLWTMWDVSGFVLPHSGWLAMRAGGRSKITLNFFAIRCGCISSNVVIRVRIPMVSRPSSFMSSLSCQARYLEQ